MNQEIETTYLSGLNNGESAVITKIKGHGAFRKRITEMGFVSGTKVKAIKKAPLQDPVEYELMDYRVSLRKNEAQLIEIISEKKAEQLTGILYSGTFIEDILSKVVKEKSHTINVALVGNPNSGKTTLFNFATGKREKVGNYGGVTVDVKTAHLKKGDYSVSITDLPGTYSISEYSPEELYVRKHLTDSMPDVVINVIDASNLERNLYLTTQLIDMNIKVVIALNMYDELEAKGDKLDYDLLGKMIGIPIIPTVASKGKGIDELLSKIIGVYTHNVPVDRHIHINYGNSINASLEILKREIKKNEELSSAYHSQYSAIKLLENDNSFIQTISDYKNVSEILNTAKKEIEKLEKEFRENSETIIADAKYGFIRGALKETFQQENNKKLKAFNNIDGLLTHKWLGFPIFLLLMWAMFQLTFSLGSIPMDWIDSGVGLLGKLLESYMSEGILRDLIIDGIIGGAGSVIVFLPNIIILFFCISLMEDTGYMARTAFIMDRLMHKMGLHGKSFIPLLMGFGCNVPAVMATRTLENRKDRLLTMLIIPFMSCNARLPVYVLLISAFFPFKQGLVLLSIYFIGVILAVLMALIFKKIMFSKKDIPFVMELPPYRIPTIRNTTIHMWNKSQQYLTKMGTTILLASIIIWALGYFPREVEYSKDYETLSESINNDTILQENEKQEQLNQVSIEQKSEHMEKSYIGQMGHFITPIIEPLGFDWKIGVSIITGLAAKEVVIGTIGVLYQSDTETDESSVSLKEKLQQQTYTDGPKAGQKVFTPLVAYTLMIFILIYFPCVAVIAAIKREASWKWSVFTMVYTTTLAWLVSFCVYSIANLF